MLIVKKSKLLILFVTVFVILSSVVPTISEASSNQEVEVIIGYENESGRKAIENNSSTLHQDFANLKAVSVTMEAQKLKKLRTNKNLTYFEEDMDVQVSDKNITFTEITDKESIRERSWNMQVINAPMAWKENFTGKGVKIAVVDSGIAAHADLPLAGGVSTVDYTDEWIDDNGHGTHVAGLIGADLNDQGVAGAAPDASLYAVKALDNNGEGTLTDFLEAIDWSIQNEMDIINLSLGTDTESEAMKNILQQAYDQGILIVGSSGNNWETGGVDFPAKFESVIAVSAADISLAISDYSSRGPEIEFSAPGTEVISTFLDGRYASTSGTSTASPHVTGLLAVLKERFPNMTHRELRKELQYHTEDLGEPGKDPLFGNGLLHYSVFDIFPPAEVDNLSETQIDSNSVRISWEPPAKDFAKVNVFIEGEWIGSVLAEEEQSFVIENLPAGAEKHVTIQTEDKIGNGSMGMEYLAKGKAVEADLEEEKETKSEAQTESIQETEPVEKKETSPAASSESENVKSDETEVAVEENKSTKQSKAPIEKAEKISELEETEEITENSKQNGTKETSYPALEKEQSTSLEQTNLNESDASESLEEVSEIETKQVKEEIKITASTEQGTESALADDNKAAGEDKGFFIKFLGGIASLFQSLLSGLGNILTF